MSFDPHSTKSNGFDVARVSRREAKNRFGEAPPVGKAAHDDANSPRRRTQFIGRSPVVKHLLEIVARIAPKHSNVLITGATGTGKELVAHMIHEQSTRSNAPFVDVNCSTIPENLFEAELFGHQRGTFTGAHETRRGLFEEAEGGTLFLDEVDSLNFSAQAKLLRVLQERWIRRVGGRENISLDVRFIAASNRDLFRAVAEGSFRSDLFFRLSVIPLHVPGLRARPGDISLLINYFLERHAERYGEPLRHFSVEAMRVLNDYTWPGNVRELENVVEYALTLGTNEELSISNLPPELYSARFRGRETAGEFMPEGMRLEEIERRYIVSTYERQGKNQLRTANILGIDRRTLQRKLQQYNATPHEPVVLPLTPALHDTLALEQDE